MSFNRDHKVACRRPALKAWSRPSSSATLAAGISAIITIVSGLAPGVTLSVANAEPTTYDSAVMMDGAIGYWKLDELTGSIAEDFVGSNDAVYVDEYLGEHGRPPIAPGGLFPDPSARSTSENLLIDSSILEEAEEFSIEFWSDEWSPEPDNAYPLIQVGLFEIFADASTFRDEEWPAQLRTGHADELPNDGASDFVAIPDGSHLVLVYDGTDVALFVNGTVEATLPVGSGADLSEFVMFDTDDSSAYDNVAVYDRALSGSEINDHRDLAAPRVRELFGGAPGPDQIADPVNSATGNVFHSRNLLPPSFGGFGVSLYNNTLDIDAGGVFGDLGPGWFSTVDTRIEENEDGSLAFWGLDGRRLRLKSTGSDTWTAPDGSLGQIAKLGGGSYVVQFLSGERLEYDSSGKLVKRCEGQPSWTAGGSSTCSSSGAGEVTTISWSSGQPSGVSSSEGYSATFGYTSSKLSSVTIDDDPSGGTSYRTIGVGYSSDLLAWVSDPHYSSENGTGLNTTPPSYAFETYTYESGSDRLQSVSVTSGVRSGGVDLPNLSTGVPVRLVYSTFDGGSGRVATQVSADGSVASFSWTLTTGTLTVQSYPAGFTGTCVVASGCHETVYNHDQAGRVIGRRDSEMKSASTAWGHPGTAAERQAVKPTQATDRLGAVSGYNYDSGGRLTQVAKPVPSGAYAGFVPPLASAANRLVFDGVTTSSSTTLTSATAAFSAWDVGSTVTGDGIPGSTTIVTVSNATTVVLSAAATATDTDVEVAISQPCKRDASTGAFPAPSTGSCSGRAFTVESYTYDSASRVTVHTNAAGDETTYTYGGSNTTTLPDEVSVGSNTDDSTNAPAVVTTFDVDYANKRIDSSTSGATSTCYLYDSYDRVLATTTVAASSGCPSSPTNASTTVKYGVGDRVVETTKPAPTEGDASRTAAWGTSFSGVGRVRQQAAPDPADGFLPPLAADAGAEDCKRDADGMFPVPDTGDCAGRKFTIVSYTYYPTGETLTKTDELGNTTTWVIERNLTGTGDGECGSGVTLPCRTVTRCGPNVGSCTIADARDTGQGDWDIDATVYDAFGDAVQTIAAGGAVTTSTYGALGRLMESVAPPPSTSPTADAVVTRYVYDDDGRLTATQAGTSSTGTQETTTYDIRGRVASRTSRAHNGGGTVTTSYTYDVLDRVITESVNSGEQVRTASYFKTGQVKETTAKRADYGGTSSSGVCASTSYRCSSTKHTYDAAGRVVTDTTRVSYTSSTENTVLTGYAYDPVTGQQSQVATADPADGYVPPVTAGSGVCKRASDGSFPTPNTGDCAGKHFMVSTSNYFNGGALRGSKTELQHLNHPAYDDATWQTTFGYDARGRNHTMTTPNPGYYAGGVGNTTSVTTTCYTARGEPRATIGPDDGASGTHPTVTASAYDDEGRLTSSWDPTAFAALGPGDDCADVETAIAGFSGHAGHVTYEYDGRGNRLERHSWDGGGTQRDETWTYNLDNSIATATDPLGNVTTHSYTVTDGRLDETSVTTGAAHDRLVSSVWVSSLRTVTTELYPSGKPEKVTSRLYANDGTTVASSYVVGYEYDGIGRRSKVTQDPGGTPKDNIFAYNEADQVTSVTYQEPKYGGGTATSTWTYDLGGRQTALTNPAGTNFRYLYDRTGRYTEMDILSFGVWVPLATYSYYDIGDGTSSTKYCPSGQSCVHEALSTGGTNLRLDAYEPRTGARTGMLETVNSTTTNYSMTVDRSGRLATDCKYTGSSCNTGSDRVQHYSYDVASQLTGVTVDNVSNGTIKAWAYTYDNRGNRLSHAATTKGSPDSTVTTYYAYDEANQLCQTNSAASPTCATTSNKTAAFTYDKAGRRLANTPTSGTALTYEYDARGLLSTYGKSTNQLLTYDALGYLIGIDNPSGGDYEKLFWNYSGTSDVPQVLQWTGNGLNRAFSFGDNKRITSTSTWYAYDNLGSTTYSHTAVTTTYYDPNGNPSPANTGNLDVTYRSELTLRGLIYLRARNYDPTTNTFLTRDPLDGVDGDPSVSNGYHYASNDPTNRQDPSGERPVDSNLSSQSPGPCGAALCNQRVGVISNPFDRPYDEIIVDLLEALIPQLEAVGETQAALVAQAGVGPSPRADVSGFLIALQAVQESSETTVSNCRNPDGSEVRTERYQRVVKCVTPVDISGGTLAFTQGHYIFCKHPIDCTFLSSRWVLRHELVHVAQYERYGDMLDRLKVIENRRALLTGSHDIQCENKYEREAYNATPDIRCR